MPRADDGRQSRKYTSRASENARSSRRDRDDAGPSRSRRRVVRDDDDDDDEDVDEDQEEEEEDDAEEGDEDDEAEQEEDEGSDNDADGGTKLKMPKVKKLPVGKAHKKAAEKIGKEEISRRANDLVRLALFCEYRRIPIKREDITKKVLGQSARGAFPVVFNKAAKTLRKTFGMELVELRARGADNEQILAAIDNTGAGKKRKGGGDDDEDGEGGAKKGGSKSWILRSLLPPSIIRGMQAPIPDLAALHAETDGKADNVTGEHDAEGSMLDWKRADGQLGSMGLLFVVLSFILLNGRTIRDDELRAQLRRLSLEPNSVLPTALRPDAYEASNPSGRRGRASASQGGALSGASSGTSMTLEGFLSLMVRQSYLEQIVSDAGGPSTQGGGSMGASTATDGRRKQRRGAARSGDGAAGEGPAENTFEWRWGARAEAEIGEKAVARFVGDVFYGKPLVETRNGRRGGRRAGAGGTTRSGRTSRGRRDAEESESESEDDDDIEEVDAQGNVINKDANAAGQGEGEQGGGGSSKKKQKLGLIKEIERAAGSQLIE